MITQWYVNELSKLTNVSVRTLHHYDEIGLLKPSVRSSNGYRLYSESDVVTLQKIIALKYVGFELAKIKELMSEKSSLLDHLQAQKAMLEEKAASLHEVLSTLSNVITRCNGKDTASSEEIFQLIRVYRMSQEFKNSWASKILTPEQLDQMSNLYAQFTPEEGLSYQHRWKEMISKVQKVVHTDPTTPASQEIFKEWIGLVFEVYGNKESTSLRRRLWQAYKNNEMPQEFIPADVIEWIDKATQSHNAKRTMDILDAAKKISAENPASATAQTIAQRWVDLLEERFGDDENSKTAFYAGLEATGALSFDLKNWLEKAIKALPQ